MGGTGGIGCPAMGAWGSSSMGIEGGDDGSEGGDGVTSITAAGVDGGGANADLSGMGGSAHAMSPITIPRKKRIGRYTIFTTHPPAIALSWFLNRYLTQRSLEQALCQTIHDSQL
jgi:hypothetical protein